MPGPAPAVHAVRSVAQREAYDDPAVAVAVEFGERRVQHQVADLRDQRRKSHGVPSTGSVETG